MSASKRVEWPDIAKGIGILMVVLFHTFIPRLREQFGFYFVHALFSTVQMPLFFFVSGWLFELKADKYKQNRLRAVGHKFLRLMVPYFSFSIVYYLLINLALSIDAVAPMIQMSNGGYESYSLGESVLQILTFQGSMVKTFWFIYALFIISAVNILFPKLMKHPATAVVLLLSRVLLLFYTDAPQLLVYFLCYSGYFSLARFAFSSTDKILAMKKYIYVIISVIYLICASAYSIADYFGLFDSVTVLRWINGPICAAVAILGILFICVGASYISKSVHVSKVLTYFGRNSMVIYLIHAPILAPSVVSLTIKFLPSVPPIVGCIVGAVVAVAIPLLLSKFIFEKVPILNTVFLGAPYKKREKI